jgi:hypothetical protein
MGTDPARRLVIVPGRDALGRGLGNLLTVASASGSRDEYGADRDRENPERDRQRDPLASASP